MALDPICIIPAKGTSTRFPGKNLATLAGIPLFWHAVRTAAKTALFKDIWVNTDSREIAESATRTGALPYMRPPELALGHVQVAAVCVQQVAEMKLPSRTPVCIMLPTAPLTRAEDVSAALSRFNDEAVTVEVLHAVARYEHPLERALRLEDGRLKWVGGDPAVIDQGTQTFPAAYRITGGFTWVRARHLVETRSYVHDRMLGYAVPRWTAVDIDEPGDLMLTEAVLSAQSKAP